MLSHPAWGEWIEICCAVRCLAFDRRLTPHGVSGLKSRAARNDVAATGLTPHGVSGLKWKRWFATLDGRSLTPHGVSGLKSSSAPKLVATPWVSPRMG